MKEIAIIGGGIAGLACAYEILSRSPGTNVRLLEATDRAGGNIRTTREDGFVLEWGVNGFLDNVPETLDLVERIDLPSELLPASDAAGKRFLFRDGRLREVPMRPDRFLRSDLLSRTGRLRVLGEPFARRTPEGDETVFDFAARRIGREAAEILVDAMVAGVYAGDARRLSLQSTFPKMAEMEREHGSLLRALVAKQRAARRAGRRIGGPAGPGGVLTSFRTGMETLVERLVDRIGSRRIHLSRRVAAVDRVAAGYRVRTMAGEIFDAEGLVVAAPAPLAAPFLATLDGCLADELAAIPTAGLSVVALAWRDEDLPAPLDGFGFLVPRGQGVRILGCLWDSCVFEGRAPRGWVLLRAMIGGAHDPEAVSLSDREALEAVLADLRAAMGIARPPRETRIYRHPLGIPQYEVGHGARLDRIAGRLAALPGLELAGNSYRGVAVNHCVQEARAVATHLLSRATARPGAGSV